MAGDCGLNALSLLPENVLPQWQQKIAMQKIMQVDEVTKCSSLKKLDWN